LSNGTTTNQQNEPNEYARSGDEMDKNSKGPEAVISKKRAVSVTEAQSLRYVRLKDIELDTGFPEEKWKIFAIKELLDNALDWLNEVYPVPKNGKDIRKIGVGLWISKQNENHFIHIAIRNSNVSNIAVFEDLDKIFDFGAWHGTKRLQHRATAGGLGDALKRCLGMGYASWTKDYDPDALEDKKWHKPVIVKCNGNESKVFIIVNTSKSTIDPDIQKTQNRDIGNDTEVTVTLPIELSEIERCIEELQQYYKMYRMGKTGNIAFSITEDIKNLEVE
jgi:hypothetical protein